MPVGLKQLPHGLFGDGFAVQATDLDASLIAPLSSLSQGGISPDSLGLLVWNASGGTLTANTLIYVSGWNVANALPQVSKASASAQATPATYVVLADIANGASGRVGLHLTSAANLNTNAATVGDAVWLDTTAGGYTLTFPPAAGVNYQRVGRVRIKSATVGVIEFDLVSLTTNITPYRQQANIPTVPTTGAVDSAIIADQPGVVLGFRLAFKDQLAASDSNFITFTVTNKAATGAGTNAMLATSPAGTNTTKVTGGAAINPTNTWTAYVLTPTSTTANLVVAAGDVLLLTATVTGTLANTVTEGVWSAATAPS